jgi:hypothetical protein
MAAVLARAVDDCHFAARHPHSCEARALVREVAAWFFEDDPCTAWPYTFRAICEELQVSVDALRRQLRRTLPSLALAYGGFGTVVEATRMAAVRV